MNPILAQSVRGEVVDNIYRGAFAVFSKGEIVRKGGNIDRPYFMRSSEKPFQAAVIVESGAADSFGLIDEEIAVIAGSHSGEDFHVAAVRSMLKKGGLDEAHLLCGVHPPLHEPSRDALIRNGKPFSAVHNNCSGKHAGMLLLAKHFGAPIENYLTPGHPVQQRIREHISLLAGCDAGRIGIGVDGCGVPTYAFPISTMAKAYANLSSPDRLPEKFAEACRRVISCVQRYPLPYAGHGRYCTEIVETTGARLIPKVGAEAVYAVGVVDAHTGIAVKIESGIDLGYRGFLVTLMRNMDIITEAEAQRLAKHVRQPLLNRRGEETGYIEAVIPEEQG